MAEPPTEIRLSSSAPNVLRCEALLRGQVLAVRDLTEGRDFRFAEGRIRLAGTLGESGILEGGIGISTEVNRLGLTERGDVVLSCNSSGAGLMLFVVPLATSGSREAVFERIAEGEPTAR